MSDPNTAVLDDGDATSFGFLGTWFQVKTTNKNVRNGTLSQLNSAGELFHGFIGSEIQIFGTVSPPQNTTNAHPPWKAVFLLDKEVVKTFTEPILTAEQDGMLFFSSGQLDVNNHFLEVNITGATPENPFFFDYAVVTHAPVLSSDALPFASSSSSSSSSTSSVSLVLSLSGPSQTASSTSSSESSSTSVSSTGPTALLPAQTSAAADTTNHAHKNLGAIVGGVLGGLAALLLLLFALFYLCKRNRGSAADDASNNGEKGGVADGENRGTPGVTPFLLPRDYSTASAAVVPPNPSASLVADLAGSPMVSSGKARLAGLTQSPVSSPFPSSTYSMTEGSISSEQRLIGRSPSHVSSVAGADVMSPVTPSSVDGRGGWPSEKAGPSWGRAI